MRTYAKVILGLLVVGGLFASIFFGVRAIYDAGGDAREDQVKRAYAEEKSKLLEDLAKARSGAENQIVQEKVVWRDRVQKVREVVVQCDLPPDLIRLLRESGIFTGQM